MSDVTANAPSPDELRWQALVARDPGAAGAGVYCRPTCASRLPRRANVRFFDSPSDAEEAGYRACRRCRPERSPSDAGSAAAVLRACELIDQSEETPDLGELAA